MTDANEWVGRVGESWAREWRRTDRSFGPVTDRLLDHPAARKFVAALDIGCGAGELACRLADLRPEASIIGIDISADLLAVARSRCAGPRFIDGDAAHFVPDGPAPDLLISRHGVMFFPDPVAAFAHLQRIAAPAATLRFSCFRERAENGWVTRLAEILPPDPAPADPFAPGPFAFGNSARVTRILEEAGWCDPVFEPLDYPMVAGEGPDAVGEALTYFRRIGPAARALAELAEEERDDAVLRLHDLLEAHREGDRVALPAAGWIVTASAPG